VAPAIVAGAGIVAAHALRRNEAEPVTKLSPSVCVVHCSGVRVLCAWPNRLIVLHLELTIARNEWGDVKAFMKVVHSALEVKSNGSF
jgi:hypothetical protein